NANFGREARINGASLGALLVQLLSSIVGVHQVLGRHPQAFEIRRYQRIHRILIQNPRYPNPESFSLLKQLVSLLLPPGQSHLVRRLRYLSRIVTPPDGLRGNFHEVRISALDLVQPFLDHLHVRYVLDQAFFARVADDQPLDSIWNWNLGLARRFDRLIRIRNLDVYEGPEALVLAEITTSIFIAMGFVGDLLDAIELDKRSLKPILP